METVVRPVNLNFAQKFSRHVVDVFAVEHHAKIAESVFERLRNEFVFGRQKDFVALPLAKLFDNDACRKLDGGVLGAISVFWRRNPFREEARLKLYPTARTNFDVSPKFLREARV